ncbi:hypothetical protein QBC47DRAFT_438500 [Echria macrotheca]|uniref:Uncharacterized protein n=1 Tax=Echria macrotheca TaxID=438768 RepID=A0AAJ0B2L8_9PEZI|nr:hypothetical protein QBC47DRAFT_438500 [Echria macrotheca]
MRGLNSAVSAGSSSQPHDSKYGVAFFLLSLALLHHLNSTPAAMSYHGVPSGAHQYGYAHPPQPPPVQQVHFPQQPVYAHPQPPHDALGPAMASMTIAPQPQPWAQPAVFEMDAASAVVPSGPPAQAPAKTTTAPAFIAELPGSLPGTPATPSQASATVQNVRPDSEGLIVVEQPGPPDHEGLIPVTTSQPPPVQHQPAGLPGQYSAYRPPEHMGQNTPLSPVSPYGQAVSAAGPTPSPSPAFYSPPMYPSGQAPAAQPTSQTPQGPPTPQAGHTQHPGTHLSSYPSPMNSASPAVSYQVPSPPPTQYAPTPPPAGPTNQPAYPGPYPHHPPHPATFPVSHHSAQVGYPGQSPTPPLPNGYGQQPASVAGQYHTPHPAGPPNPNPPDAGTAP